MASLSITATLASSLTSILAGGPAGCGCGFGCADGGAEGNVRLNHSWPHDFANTIRAVTVAAMVRTATKETRMIVKETIADVTQPRPSHRVAYSAQIQSTWDTHILEIARRQLVK